MAETEEKKIEPPAVPVARIVSPKEREKMVPLEYPVEFDGRLYEEIRVRRVTGVEIAAFSEALRVASASGGEMPIPPVIDCPLQVWGALDADDLAAVEDASQDFFPRRLKAVAEELGFVIGERTSDQ